MRRPGAPLVVAAVAAAALGLPVRSSAEPNGPAEKSLDRCQSAMRTEGAKYLAGTQKAIATCLAKVSGEVLKKNAGVSGAVKTCTATFDRIGRSDGRSLADRFASGVTRRCQPAPPNAHGLGDLLGTFPGGVAEPLDVGVFLGAFCSRFGGDGQIHSLQQWIDCAREAHDCSAHSAIATEFPRSVQWLGQLAAEMPPSPARDALVAAEAALDGATDDGFPDVTCIACGEPGGPACEPADDCPAELLTRQPHEVLADLRAAIAAEDWEAAACNYHASAFLIDDQGVLVGRQEIVDARRSLAALFPGVTEDIHEENLFGSVVRTLFTLDGGWIVINDGIHVYRIERGQIREQSTHGLIEFTGPPPE